MPALDHSSAPLVSVLRLLTAAPLVSVLRLLTAGVLGFIAPCTG